MPIYEYICQDCHTRFEARRAMSDADRPIACPKCGAANPRRAISRFFASVSGEGAVAGSGSSCSTCSSSSCTSCGKN